MGMFKSKCPHCGEELELQEEWSNMEGECPFCHKTFTIPEPEKKAKKLLLKQSIHALPGSPKLDKSSNDLIPSNSSIKLFVFVLVSLIVYLTRFCWNKIYDNISIGIPLISIILCIVAFVMSIKTLKALKTVNKGTKILLCVNAASALLFLFIFIYNPLTDLLPTENFVTQQIVNQKARMYLPLYGITDKDSKIIKAKFNRNGFFVFNGFVTISRKTQIMSSMRNHIVLADKNNRPTRIFLQYLKTKDKSKVSAFIEYDKDLDSVKKDSNKKSFETREFLRPAKAKCRYVNGKLSINYSFNVDYRKNQKWFLEDKDVFMNVVFKSEDFPMLVEAKPVDLRLNQTTSGALIYTIELDGKLSELDVNLEQIVQDDKNNPDKLTASVSCWRNGTWYFNQAKEMLAGIKVPKNDKKAFLYLQKSVAFGYENAVFELAKCYINGLGTNPDKASAFEIVKALAESGNQEAELLLSEYYFTGTGVPADAGKGFKILQKLKEDGNVEAKIRIALCYHFDIVVKRNDTRAFTEIQEAAMEGNALALLWLGKFLYDGIGTKERQTVDAFRHFQQSAKQGNVEAALWVSYFRWNNIGTERNQETARSEIKRLAEAGDSHAQCVYARLLLSGEILVRGMIYWGTVSNNKDAFLWLKKAAEKGNAQAQLELGCCYALGIGVEKNLDLVKSWWQTSIRTDVKQFERLVTLLDTKGLPDNGAYGNGRNNLEEAAYWLEFAAEMKNADAQIELARRYMHGRGVERNVEKAKDLFEDAVRNNPAKSRILAKWYQNGKKGFSKNHKLAFYWMQKAADKGVVLGMIELAEYYRNGVGVQKDPEKAFVWMKNAADTNDSYAQYWLGLYYFNGVGTQPDRLKTKEILEKSAKQKEGLSMYFLADQLCDDNPEEKFEWMKKAAETEFYLAQLRLARLYEKGVGVKKDEKKAFEWMKKAAYQSPSDVRENGGQIGEAQLALANYFKDGFGVKADSGSEFSWIAEASKNGYAEAQFMLAKEYWNGTRIEEDKEKTLKLIGLAINQKYDKACEWIVEKAKDISFVRAWNLIQNAAKNKTFKRSDNVYDYNPKVWNWICEKANEGNGPVMKWLQDSADGRISMKINDYDDDEEMLRNTKVVKELKAKALESLLKIALQENEIAWKWIKRKAEKGNPEIWKWIVSQSKTGNHNAKKLVKDIPFEYLDIAQKRISETHLIVSEYAVYEEQLVNWIRKCSKNGNKKAEEILKELPHEAVSSSPTLRNDNISKAFAEPSVIRAFQIVKENEKDEHSERAKITNKINLWMKGASKEALGFATQCDSILVWLKTYADKGKRSAQDVYDDLPKEITELIYSDDQRQKTADKKNEEQSNDSTKKSPQEIFYENLIKQLEQGGNAQAWKDIRGIIGKQISVAFFLIDLTQRAEKGDSNAWKDIQGILWGGFLSRIENKAYNGNPLLWGWLLVEAASDNQSAWNLIFKEVRLNSIEAWGCLCTLAYFGNEKAWKNILKMASDPNSSLDRVWDWLGEQMRNGDPKALNFIQESAEKGNQKAWATIIRTAEKELQIINNSKQKEISKEKEKDETVCVLRRRIGGDGRYDFLLTRNEDVEEGHAWNLVKKMAEKGDKKAGNWIKQKSKIGKNYDAVWEFIQEKVYNPDVWKHVTNLVSKNRNALECIIRLAEAGNRKAWEYIEENANREKEISQEVKNIALNEAKKWEEKRLGLEKYTIKRIKKLNPAEEVLFQIVLHDSRIAWKWVREKAVYGRKNAFGLTTFMAELGKSGAWESIEWMLLEHNNSKAFEWVKKEFIKRQPRYNEKMPDWWEKARKKAISCIRKLAEKGNQGAWNCLIEHDNQKDIVDCIFDMAKNGNKKAKNIIKEKRHNSLYRERGMMN